MMGDCCQMVEIEKGDPAPGSVQPPGTRDLPPLPEERPPKIFAGQAVAIAGGLLGALAAASCCVLPFTLFALGISGAWIGTLTALAPLQPIFAFAAFGFIGFGAYRLRRARLAACTPGSYCAVPRSQTVARLGLMTASVLVVAAVVFPYVIRFIAF